MLRTFLALTALAAAPAALADEVTDVLLLRGEQQLWIALDGRPDGLFVETRTGALRLQLAGFQPLEARTIAPQSNARVDTIAIQPTAIGADIVIEGGFDLARAELRQGGVLIDFAPTTYQAVASVSDWNAAALTEAERTRSGTDARAEDPSGGDLEVAALFQIAEPAEPVEQGSAPDTAPRAGDPAGAPATGPRAPTRYDAADEAAGNTQAETIPAEAGQSQTPEAAPDPDIPGPCDATAATVASSPWDLDALTVHAGCLVEIGEINNGAGLYERVLAFEPSHFQAALGLARIRERQGRRNEAARLFETAANSALTDGQALAARQAARRLQDEN
jgi:hypothetical protein